jgi:peptidoglycan-N-acetylglucosamine deacetylase
VIWLSGSVGIKNGRNSNFTCGTSSQEKSKGNIMRKILLTIFFILIPSIAVSQVITELSTEDKVVALTFDACEIQKPYHFDKSILNYIINEKIPVTLFISGTFARDNKDEIMKITAYDFIEIENHSVHHNNHMETLSNSQILAETDDSFIYNITGKRPLFFRFPAGNYNKNALSIVEKKYRVVHWTFASGDWDKNVSPRKLTDYVLSRTKPGSILIFHINGRGYSTGKALPEIIKGLKEQGYVLVKLEDYLK